MYDGPVRLWKPIFFNKSLPLFKRVQQALPMPKEVPRLNMMDGWINKYSENKSYH